MIVDDTFKFLCDFGHSKNKNKLILIVSYKSCIHFDILHFDNIEYKNKFETLKRKKDSRENKDYPGQNKKQKIELVNNFDSYFDIGDLDHKCKFCGALYWNSEYSKKICCMEGKIKLPPLSEYDERLKNLLYDRNFRNLIRYYNSAFAFVTFQAAFETLNSGPFNLKIHGEVYHNSPSSILPKYNQTPSCGQIYIYLMM